jgi:hypothetical protein
MALRRTHHAANADFQDLTPNIYSAKGSTYSF